MRLSADTGGKAVRGVTTSVPRTCSCTWLRVQAGGWPAGAHHPSASPQRITTTRAQFIGFVGKFGRIGRFKAQLCSGCEPPHLEPQPRRLPVVLVFILFLLIIVFVVLIAPTRTVLLLTAHIQQHRIAAGRAARARSLPAGAVQVAGPATLQVACAGQQESAPRDWIRDGGETAWAGWIGAMLLRMVTPPGSSPRFEVSPKHSRITIMSCRSPPPAVAPERISSRVSTCQNHDGDDDDDDDDDDDADVMVVMAMNHDG